MKKTIISILALISLGLFVGSLQAVADDENVDENKLIQDKSFLRENPKYLGPFYYLGKAEAYREMSRTEDSKKYYLLILGYYPQEAMSHYQLSNKYLSRGKYSIALEEFKLYEKFARANMEEKDEWEFSLGRARILKAMGKYDEALIEYNNYIDKSPETPEMSDEMEQIYKERDEVKEYRKR